MLDKRSPPYSSLDFTALITGTCYLPYISCLKALIGRLKWSMNLPTKVAQVSPSSGRWASIDPDLTRVDVFCSPARLSVLSVVSFGTCS